MSSDKQPSQHPVVTFHEEHGDDLAALHKAYRARVNAEPVDAIRPVEHGPVPFFMSIGEPGTNGPTAEPPRMMSQAEANGVDPWGQALDPTPAVPIPDRFASLSRPFREAMQRAVASKTAARETGPYKSPPTRPSPEPPAPAAPEYPTCGRCGRAHYVGPTASDPAYCHLNWD
jgi:hypothetical protein